MVSKKYGAVIILIIFSLFILISSFSASASTTITDSSIESTGNLTLGQKITFALGEIIDNIVDGFIRITGNLNVTGNATVSGTSLKVNNTEVCLFDGTNCQRSNPMGEVSVTNNSLVTAITAANTWTLVNASWAGNAANMLFQNYTNGTLLYNGTETMFFHIAMTISLNSEGANDVMRASIFKNGTLLSGSQIQQKLQGIGDTGSTAIHVATTLSTGDTLNVYVLNQNNADDFTVTYVNMFAMGMRIG